MLLVQVNPPASSAAKKYRASGKNGRGFMKPRYGSRPSRTGSRPASIRLRGGAILVRPCESLVRRTNPCAKSGSVPSGCLPCFRPEDWGSRDRVSGRLKARKGSAAPLRVRCHPERHEGPHSAHFLRNHEIPPLIGSQEWDFRVAWHRQQLVQMPTAKVSRQVQCDSCFFH